MSIVINDSLQAQTLGDLIAGEAIKASSYEDIAANQHRLFAIQGLRASLFQDANVSPGTGFDFLTVTTSSYTQTNAATLYNATDLGMFSPVFRGFRDLEGNAIHIRFAAYLRNASVRLTVYAPDTDTTFASTVLTHAVNDFSWQYGTLTLTSTQARAGGLLLGDPRPLSLYAEFKSESPTTGVTSGQLYQLTVREYVLTSSDTTLIPQ